MHDCESTKNKAYTRIAQSTSYFKRKITTLIDRFSDKSEKTESFLLFANLARERGYVAKMDRGRGQRLMDKEHPGGISGFWSEDVPIKIDGKPSAARFTVMKYIYIPKAMLERTDRLLIIDANFVDNAFRTIVSHEHYERELILKSVRDGSYEAITESKVNKLVMDELIARKEDAIGIFTDLLAYECLLLPADTKRQIELNIPEGCDGATGERIVKIAMEKVGKYYGVLYQKEIEEFKGKLSERKDLI